MKTMIKVDGVSYRYGKRRILDTVSLQFQEGEVVSLLGPNGSGKTTLLKIILGLFAPAEGIVNYKDRPLATIPRKLLARELAYVPQVHRDAFTYSVIDVVLMGRMPYHSFFSAYSDTDYQIAYDALMRLGIGSLRDRPYTEISGGERQLTLIARSVAQGARTFIMDEPVNGLDYGNQMRLLRSIRILADEGYTFIITTHFPDHALMCADRVVLLKNGIVLADGLPNEIITRETIYSLYRVEVDVVPVNGSGSFCVPVWSN